MNKKRSLLLVFLTLQALSSCNVPTALQAQNTQSQAPLRATLVSTASGQSLRVIQLEQLPAELRNASKIQAILDNSSTSYDVQKNADGTLSIPLTAGRRPDSQGLIEILLTNGQKSWLLSFDTGPLLKLESSPFSVEPGSQVTLGSSLKLGLRFAESASPPDLTKYVFSWSASTSSNTGFAPISGTRASVDWEPSAAGNYYIRLEMRELASGATSVFTSSAPLVFVASPDRIALREPADGRILAGDSLKLTANIPEYASQNLTWLWSYAVSPQAPFVPIAAQGKQIDWEPPAAGSYYLRLQAEAGGRQQSYTSSQPMVLVANADEVISTQPTSGEVVRGQAIQLSASLPKAEADWRYLWSYGTAAQGSFTAIAGESANISWIPDQTGEFYLRVRAIDPASGSENTYTSAEPLVSVRDDDKRFILTPSPASLVKGQSVLLSLADIAGGRTINWFYAPSAQGPFSAITGQGQNVRWSPPFAGTFYLRAEVTGADQPKATYTSASALVSVSEATGVISATPEGNQRLGQPITLSAQVPDAPAGASYSWSVGQSPLGPWQAAQSLDDSLNGPRLNWLPGSSGNYYVKVDMTRPDTGNVVSFVSPRALVFIANSRDFFTTNPSPAVIGTQGAVSLSASTQLPGGQGYTYVWSSAPGPVGPFTALGASVTPRFSWVRPGLVGNYFIKLDVIAPNRKAVGFVSSEALVFVGESTTRPGG